MAKILLVADDAGQRRAAHRILEPLGEIFEAATGKDALRLVTAEKPDLMLLLDVVMTEMDGISIVRAARFLDPGLPIVMAAEDHVIETAQRSLSIGASAYMRRPYDPEGLRDEIRRLLIRR